MSLWLKQSTAKAVSFGPFLDKTDGVTPEVGLVSAIDHAATGILLSKNGGALTIRHAAVTASTYDAYGNYIVTLDTTDTNTLGTLRMQFIETATCLPVWQDFLVVSAAVWDWVHGSTIPPVNVTQFGGSAGTFSAGVPEVNTVKVGGGTTPSGSIPNAVAGAAGGLFIAGTNAATVVTTSITTGTIIANVSGSLSGTVGGVSGNVTGNVSGSVGSVVGAVGSVAGAVGSVTGNVGGNVTGSVGSLAAQAKTDVNGEVVDCLTVDTYAEPSAVVSATSTLAAMLGWLKALARNKRTQTATTETLLADDGTTPVATSTKSDNGTTFTRGEFS